MPAYSARWPENNAEAISWRRYAGEALDVNNMQRIIRFAGVSEERYLYKT